jgi:hypothetical protein
MEPRSTKVQDTREVEALLAEDRLMAVFRQCRALHDLSYEIMMVALHGREPTLADLKSWMTSVHSIYDKMLDKRRCGIKEEDERAELLTQVAALPSGLLELYVESTQRPLSLAESAISRRLRDVEKIMIAALNSQAKS